MMNKAKDALARVRNHVKENKFGYAMAGIAVGAIALQQWNLRTFYEFLEEKGIDKLEFTCPEFYEELKNS